MSGGTVLNWLRTIGANTVPQAASLAQPMPVQVISTDPLGSVVQGANTNGVAITSGGLRIMTKGPTGLAADLLSNSQGDLRVQDVGRALRVEESVNIPVGPSTAQSSVIALGYPSGSLSPWDYYTAAIVTNSASAVATTPQVSIDGATWFDAAASINVTATTPAIFKIPAMFSFYRIFFSNTFAIASVERVGHGLIAS